MNEYELAIIDIDSQIREIISCHMLTMGRKIKSEILLSVVGELPEECIIFKITKDHF